MPKIDWQARAEALEQIVIFFHWAARRYFDGRSTISVQSFNESTRALLSLGVILNPTADEMLWARDAMGRAYDGLTAAEAAEGEPQ